MSRRKQRHKGHYYALIAAKQRHGRQFGLVAEGDELQEMLAEHYPIYRQQRFRNFADALAALERMLAREYPASAVTKTDFAGFLNASEAEETAYTEHAHRLCFYDSEFGMYNYGEQQGDVVSIGAVILEEGGQAVFSALIQNTDSAQLAERFQSFTGISPEELRTARPFPEVYEAFKAFLAEHEVSSIYCLGNNDQERFSYMLQKYGLDTAVDRSILLRFRNFQKWLRDYDTRLAAFSLESLCELCGVEVERMHDACSDALALAAVWQHLSEEGVSLAQIEAEQAAIRARSQYKKGRRISFERLYVTEDVLKARDVLVEAICATNKKTRVLSPNLMRAFCDDLEALLVSKETGEREV